MGNAVITKQYPAKKLSRPASLTQAGTKELKQSLKKLEALMYEAPVGICHTDLTGRFTFVNKRFEKVSGYWREDVIGKSGFKLGILSEETLKLLRKRMKDRLAGRPRRVLETQFKRKDGNWIWVAIEGQLIRERGIPLGFQIIAKDITDRKRAEEALQAEKNKLQSVVDAMEYGLTIQDRDYNILYQNGPLKIFFGDHLGKKCYRAYEGRDTVCDDCPVEKAFKDGKSHSVEKRGTTPSGEISFRENTANPIRDASGNITTCLEITRDITQRKQVEEELKLRVQILDGATDSILVHDNDDNFIYVNEAACRTHGYSREEFFKMKLPQIVNPERSRPLASDRQELLEKGQIAVESAHLRKDGSIMPVEVHARLLESGGEKIFLTVARDITERKQAEELYETLANSSPVGVYIVQEGKFRFANPQFQKFTGFSENELLDTESLELVHPEDRERVRENAVEMLKGKRLSPYELRYIVKSGKILWARETVTSIQYQGKRAVLGNFMDITEYKRVEEALQESQEALRKIFESATDGISVIDLNGVIIEANQRILEMHGFSSKDELLGKSAFELVAPRDHEKIAKNMRQTLKGGTIRGVEYTLLKSDGSEFLGELSTSVLKDASGKPVGHVTISRDITERKQMEEQLMMTERLASIGELASGIAHELNNPLTSVIGFSQLLMENDSADDIKEDLGLIYSEAQRAAGIVKNLLTFARKHPPAKQLSQINNVIEDILKLRTYEQKVNNIEVHRQFAPDLPKVMIDYFQMQQAFLNIVINAEHVMTQANNKGRLTITTERVNNTVRISFADNGPGIPKENLSRIFNPFFTTKEVGKGTGLGLSICHGIVTGHGGSMYARSRPGKGATFVVELPINNSGLKREVRHGTD